MDFPVLLLITATVLMLVHKGSNTNRRPSANVAPQVHLRERRCSCENLKDKECVYFCHIGIVWVDTPSQVIPYGLGSSQRRRKRHVERCVCVNPRDAPCLRFCSNVKQDVENGTVKMPHRKTFKERYKS